MAAEQSATLRLLIGNLLDQWERVPNDLKSDPAMDGITRAVLAFHQFSLVPYEKPVCRVCKEDTICRDGCGFWPLIHQAWISCDELQPPCANKYLAASTYPDGEKHVQERYYSMDGEWDGSFVTHWMPLPEAP